jgi:ribosomal protein S18 acetylase RimI-like enzyme
MKDVLVVRNGCVKDGEKVLQVWDEFMDYHKGISALDFNMVKNARKMWIKYFEKHVRSRIRNAIVAECNGRIVGFLLGTIEKRPPIFTTPHQAYIDSIGVLKSKRNHGVGGMMMDAFMKWAKEKKLPYVMLNVAVENEMAIRFYKKRGFKTMMLSQRKLL